MTETTEFGGLFCEVTLPLEWAPAVEPASLSSSLELANQNCLKTVLGLDEVSQDVSEEMPELGHELQRLDFKINIILELVAQLAAQNSHLPEAVEFKLGPSMLQWTSPGTPPQVGQWLHLKIYPDPRFPFPLLLPGKVTSVSVTTNGHQVDFELSLADELSQELLEKYIFRCHRRHIAKIKSLKTN